MTITFRKNNSSTNPNPVMIAVVETWADYKAVSNDEVREAIKGHKNEAFAKEHGIMLTVKHIPGVGRFIKYQNEGE